MINIEYQDYDYNFPQFFKNIQGKEVAVICDINTEKYAKKIIKECRKYSTIYLYVYPDYELIPDEDAVRVGLDFVKGKKYLLAVGSGTLNDLSKYISTKLSIPCGVLATAPSMDGYASKGSALIENGYKVTHEVHMPNDFLIHSEIISSAPKDMIAAGVGDILGKITCLADWRLSHILNKERIDTEAYNMMRNALDKCLNDYESIYTYKNSGIKKLMDALVIAGLSMAKMGNSRPASGSEHHISHYLEMDFINKKKHVPLHGIKVALGTLIALDLYHSLLTTEKSIPHIDEIKSIIDTLPSVEKLKAMLLQVNCPVRFSNIGIDKETFINMFRLAYSVRDRFTILTFIHELELTDTFLSNMIDKYY